MVENSNIVVIISQHHQIQMLCQHLQLQNHNLPPYPVRNPDSSSSRVNDVRLRDSSGRFLPRSDSHQSAHDESEKSSRMRNEPGSSSRDGQPIHVDAPDHAVIPGDVEMQSEESRLERMTRIPIFNVFQINLPKKILLSHDCPIHEDESRLNSLRDTCARDSQRRGFILFPRVKLLWHSVRIAWNLLVCRINTGKRIGVEVIYPVTADMFKKSWKRLAYNCVIQGSYSC